MGNRTLERLIEKASYMRSIECRESIERKSSLIGRLVISLPAEDRAALKGLRCDHINDVRQDELERL